MEKAPHHYGPEALGERRALDELHDQGAHTVRLLKPEDRRDVGMMELGEELRFALEAWRGAPCRR